MPLPTLATGAYNNGAQPMEGQYMLQFLKNWLDERIRLLNEVFSDETDN
jgi:hypothetical protein